MLEPEDPWQLSGPLVPIVRKLGPHNKATCLRSLSQGRDGTRIWELRLSSELFPLHPADNFQQYKQAFEIQATINSNQSESRIRQVDIIRRQFCLLQAPLMLPRKEALKSLPSVLPAPSWPSLRCTPHPSSIFQRSELRHSVPCSPGAHQISMCICFSAIQSCVCQGREQELPNCFPHSHSYGAAIRHTRFG